jgi:endonuclease YncB( thermonuclease family)
VKRAALFLIVPVAVLIVLLLLLRSQQTGSNTLVLDEASIVTPHPSIDGGVSEGTDLVLSHPGPPPSVRPAEVSRLVDGDSFHIRWIDTDEVDEIRLFGINAPEADACFGDASSGVLKVLTDGNELLIETIERDEFGRAVANVWVGDILVNVRLVELGAALALSDGGSHLSIIQNAQHFATENSIGMWDPVFCGSDSSVVMRIGAIEANAPGDDNLNPNGEWIDVVNDGSTIADLTEWSIRDESTRHRFSFPDRFSLPPSDTVRVFSGCGDDTLTELYWCDGDAVWNNGGDTGFLVDEDGKFADSFSYDG